MKTNNYSKRSLKISTSIAALFLVYIAANQSLAATIPAGTTVLVTTTDALSSHESRGRTFKAELANDLKAGGETVVPAGTTVFGVVEASRNQMSRTSTSPLVVNLQSIEVNGQRIRIKTTGGVTPETVGTYTSLQKRTGLSAGKSVLARGTKLEFRLAEPLHL